MYLGVYHFEGDKASLVAAYDRLFASIPLDGLLIHLCVEHERGLSVYDTCPTEEDFVAFSSSPELADAFAMAGLPTARVEKLGPVRRAMLNGDDAGVRAFLRRPG